MHYQYHFLIFKPDYCFWINFFPSYFAFVFTQFHSFFPSKQDTIVYAAPASYETFFPIYPPIFAPATAPWIEPVFNNPTAPPIIVPTTGATFLTTFRTVLTTFATCLTTFLTAFAIFLKNFLRSNLLIDYSTNVLRGAFFYGSFLRTYYILTFYILLFYDNYKSYFIY
jgi:hypothetical protein